MCALFVAYGLGARPSLFMSSFTCAARVVPPPNRGFDADVREFIDYTTSRITDEDPLRGLVFYWDSLAHYTF